MSEKTGVAIKQDAIALLRSYGLNPFKPELKKKVETNHHISTYLANTGSQTSPYPYGVTKPTFEDISAFCTDTITILHYIITSENHDNDQVQLESSIQFLQTVRRKKGYYVKLLEPLHDVFEPLNVQYAPNKHPKI